MRWVSKLSVFASERVHQPLLTTDARYNQAGDRAGELGVSENSSGYLVKCFLQNCCTTFNAAPTQRRLSFQGWPAVERSKAARTGVNPGYASQLRSEAATPSCNAAQQLL